VPPCPSGLDIASAA